MSNPTHVSEAFGPVVRGWVSQALYAQGSTLTVDDVARLGAAGRLPVELRPMYDAIGAYL